MQFEVRRSLSRKSIFMVCRESCELIRFSIISDTYSGAIEYSSFGTQPIFTYVCPSNSNHCPNFLPRLHSLPNTPLPFS